ncbi:AAA family ATPase [Methylosinus sp. RM1]|uniref:AAA family ATPase n=1 Tax=Methylosinus sp. RM1 TaxID=2583817 RepID=UPI00140752CC|nr:AAA family ATPase [Methylosinus sp. RM1]
MGNSSCLALKLIAENRKDDIEVKIPNEAFDGLQPNRMPPCLRASGSFLSSRSYSFESVMSYSTWSKDHKHIQPRPVHIPAWGALTIPYRWMLKESGFAIADELELEADKDREPDSPDWLARTSWIQGFGNQEALLDAFAAPLIEDESLVLFYATRTPLCDDERRVVLGGALLSKKHGLQEYTYDNAPKLAIRAMVWERPIQHSIRPSKNGGGFTGGFVMPYHEMLKELEKRPELNPVDYIAFAPNDSRLQFSYGSEHVSHGAAAAALVAARNALERTSEVLTGPWDRYIRWIDERLSRLWKLQGPAPGLGVVLSALHSGFNGTLFAMTLANELELNVDPWPIIDKIFTGKQKPPASAPEITSMMRRRWERIKADGEKMDSLKLLARLELKGEQAERALEIEAKILLNNPYVLFENDRTAYEPISFGTVDRGIYPGKEVATAHPLPPKCNAILTEYDNEHRLRAACVEILENSTQDGHTYLPIDKVKDAAKELSVVHDIPLDKDTVDICRDDFVPVVAVTGKGDGIAVQLDRYVTIGRLLTGAINDRMQNAPKPISVDWRALMKERFGDIAKGDVDEDRARMEKSSALECLAANRVSMLIGPAGTGKTTVIRFLLSQSDIVGSRVRLLAPTGKARVRLAQETDQKHVQTVAQLLLGTRFDADTGRYYTNAAAPKTEATTCIVDESSMLTEDMLAAIIDAVPANCRLILVGDPYQLPPIGAGCPFVDIIEYLKKAHNGKGVAELRTPRRQDEISMGKREGVTPVLERSDVQLAAIFSGRDLPPGDDEIVVNAIAGKNDETVRYRRWEKVADLPDLIDDVLLEEFNCKKDDLVAEVELSLGATRNEKGYLNFDRACSEASANWQILSVNRNGPGGSIYLNRRIKERLRAKRLNDAIDSNKVPHYRDWMRFIKPRGAEQIVYGDKVICVRNHKRAAYVYGTTDNGEKEFLANGEIGMVIGQRVWGKRSPSFTHIEFSGRHDRNFSFSRSAFSEDGQPYLELAYAITVHKAQGSEFGVVLLILPSDSRLVSREMLYTALTRQKRRIWILHQGAFDKFLSLRQYVFSDIAGRFTNLLHTPNLQAPRLVADVPLGLKGSQRGFLEERLIHRTFRGEMVSSKNELIIANILYELEKQGHLKYQVEPRLPFDDGRGRWADFIIEANGKSWYWEHCGRLDDQSYRNRWQRKLKLYAGNGYALYSDKNPDGRLIVTEDGPEQGIDSPAIAELARKLFAT